MPDKLQLQKEKFSIFLMERPYSTLKPIRLNGSLFIYKLIGCQLTLNLAAFTSGFSLLVGGGGTIQEKTLHLSVCNLEQLNWLYIISQE